MDTLTFLQKMSKSVLFFSFFSMIVFSCAKDDSIEGESNLPNETIDLPERTNADCEGEAFIQRKDAIVFPLDPSLFGLDNFVVNGGLETHQEITSSITGVTYRYHVYLPPEYELEPERSFPVLYWLDAQFWGIPNAMQPIKVVDFDELPVIVVGVEEGPAGRRAVDYIFPGISTYNRFFTEEFIPTVESKYRVLSEDRTIQGGSASGLASLAMMLSDQENPPIFKNHLAFDPFIQSTSSLQNLLNNRLSTGVPLNKTLVITSMKSGFSSSVDPYAEDLATRNISCLNIIHSSYQGDHFASTRSSTGDALRDIYSEYYEQ